MSAIRRGYLVGALLPAAVLLGGCGGSSDAPAATSEHASPAAAASEYSVATFPRCEQLRSLLPDMPAPRGEVIGQPLFTIAHCSFHGAGDTRGDVVALDARIWEDHKGSGGTRSGEELAKNDFAEGREGEHDDTVVLGSDNRWDAAGHGCTLQVLDGNAMLSVNYGSSTTADHLPAGGETVCRDRVRVLMRRYHDAIQPG